MAQRLAGNFIIFLATMSGLALLLSNVKIKERPIWAFLNSSIVLKGGQTQRMLNELEELNKNDAQFLVIGTSHAYRGYDPSVFEERGLTVFNCGSSGQSLSCSKILIDYYAHKAGSLIIDIYPGVFTEAQKESQLLLLQNTTNQNLALSMALLDPDIHVLNNWIYRACRMDTHALINESAYRGRGYVTSELVLQDSIIAAGETKLSEKEFLVFESIIDSCLAMKKRLVVISHPLPKPDKIPQSYWLFRERINRICNARRIKFLDYTFCHKLDRTHFKDANHLNQKGVEVFDEWVIADLNKILQ